MMKHVALFLLAITFALVTPTSTNAQVLVPVEEPLVNQYAADSYSSRKASWWNLLGRQLASSVDKSYEEIGVRDLQNIIFFASNHGERVKLADAIPALLDIYRHHEDEQFRMMAVAALDAIGDRGAIQELKRLSEDEPSERVNKIVQAAINNHYKSK